MPDTWRWPRFSWTERFVFPPLYGLLIYTIIRLITDVMSGTKFWLRSWTLNAIELSTVVLTAYLFAYVVRRLLRKNLRLISTNEQQGPLREFFEVILYMEIVAVVFILPMVALTDDGAQLIDVVNVCLIPPLFNLLYYTVSRGNALVQINYERQLQLEKIHSNTLQAELQMLRAQYHPHFLFNALNTVYFQIDESNDKARHTVEQLSELLRYQLYDQQEKVPVRQELDYLQSYIALQRQRMNERLQLEINLDGQWPGRSIYPSLLLPLVENAFKYVGGDYFIYIKAVSADTDCLFFEVINTIPKEAKANKSSGIGLENLRRRLELLYPERHELFSRSEGDRYRANLKVRF